MRKQKQKTSHYFRRALGSPTLWIVAAAAVLALVRAGPPARAAPGTNQQLNYQARLLTSQGAVVPDGLYNIEFKIYQDGNGVLGGGDESLKWTESHTGSNRITVKNGYFSVYLGSMTPFGTSVDWNQDTLWLSVNIGGTTVTPVFDGEMSPFTRLSSTPYAINSRQLGGLTSNQFVQLAQGQQTDGSTNASIFINDTAGGNLLHLLSGGADRFVVSNSGAIAAATALDTINGIIINNGAISGVDGFTQDSGNFDASASSGTFDTSTGAVSLNGNTTVTGVGTFTVAGGLASLGGGLTVTGGDINLDSGTLFVDSANNRVAVGTTSTTFNAASSALTVVPVGGDAINGITVKAPGSGWGVGQTYGTGQVFQYLKHGSGSTEPDDLVLFRIDNTGGVSTTGGVHIATGLRQEVGYSAPQALWIQPSMDTIGQIITAHSSQTKQLLMFQANDATILSQFTSTGLFQGATGSGANPSLSFYTDQNTGIFSGGSDILSFATGGQQRFYVASNGELRFVEGGNRTFTVETRTTNAAGNILVLKGGNGGSGATGVAGGSAVLQGGNAAGTSGAATGGSAFIYGGNGINGGDAGDVILGHNGFSAIGQVGIGILTPAATLDVAGNFKFTTTGYATINGGTTGGSSNAYGYFRSVDNGDVSSVFELGAFDLAGTSTGGRALALNPLGGNVGIGDTSPAALLSVGNGDLFQVNSSGVIAAASGINSSGTITFSSMNTTGIVTTNESGVLGTGILDRNSTSYFTSTLSVANGGTGATTLTANGVLFGNTTGAIQATAAGTGGQVLLANDSGIPAFMTFSGDVTVGSTGITAIQANSIVLATDTTGSYVSTISTGNGLSVSGVGAENATATISLDVTVAGATSTANTISGLELTSDGLSLIRGCANGELLEWQGTTTGWECNADNTGLSDSSIKTNVVALGSVLDGMGDINVVDFNFKCNDALWASYNFTCNDQTGILAQELALIFPDLVSLRPDGLNQVDFGRLNFYTLKAVTELANFIDASGNGTLNTISTGGTQRLTSTGALENITALTVNGATSLSGTSTLSGGTISLNANSIHNVNINTGTSTGMTTIGSSLSTLIINSLAFQVTSGGAVSGVSTLAASGNINTSGGGYQTAGTTRLTNSGALQNITGLTIVSGGASISGATAISGGTIDLNVGGLLTNTSINTGTSTGTVTIGGGLASLVINSTAFDVTSSGNVSTGGNINVTGTGVYQVDGTSGTTASCSGSNYPQNLNVNGGIVTSFGCASVGLSDERLKTNIVELTGDYLARMQDIQLVNFNFDCQQTFFEDTNTICDEKAQTGVVAQQLSQVFPELVYEGDDGYLRVRYEALNIYTLKAVTEMAQAFHNDYRPIFSNSQALQDYAFAPAALSADEWLSHLETMNSGTQSEIISDRVSALNALISPQVVTSLLKTSMITTGPHGLQINLTSNDGKFALVGADGEAVFEVDAEGNAYFAGDIKADNTSVLAAVDTKLQALLNTGIVTGGTSEMYGTLKIHAVTDFFDTVVFNDGVTFESIALFNNDNGGFAIIQEGSTEVRIDFEQPFPSTPVVNVSNTDGQFVNYTYTELDESGFVIILQQPASQDVSFSWTAFAIDDPRTEVSVKLQEQLNN